MEIRGSPFLPEVYDASQVTVEGIADGIVGELATFEGQFLRVHLKSVLLDFVKAFDSVCALLCYYTFLR